MKYIIQPERIYNGERFRERRINAHEDLLEKLVRVPQALVYSSWRSLEEQRELVNAGKSNTFFSNHRRGTAVDVWNWKDVEKDLNAVGLINDISWDRNHFALGGEQAATKYPLINNINNITEYKMDKEYNTVSDLRDAIEKFTGGDYEKMDSKDLQQEASIDIEEAQTHHEEAIAKLKTEHNKAIASLVEEAQKEIADIKLQYEDNIKTIMYNYEEVLDSIKDSKPYYWNGVEFKESICDISAPTKGVLEKALDYIISKFWSKKPK